MGCLSSCLRSKNNDISEIEMDVNQVCDNTIDEVYADEKHCSKYLTISNNLIKLKKKNKNKSGGCVLGNTPIHQDSCYWEVIIKRVGNTQGPKPIDDWAELNKRSNKNKNNNNNNDVINAIHDNNNDEWVASFGDDNNDNNNNDNNNNNNNNDNNNNDNNNNNNNNTINDSNNENKKEEQKQKKDQNEINKPKKIFAIGVCRERKGKKLNQELGGELEEKEEYPGSFALRSDSDIYFEDGDVIGCSFTASDLPMLTFTKNGKMLDRKYNIKRIRGVVWPAVYTNDEDVLLQYFFKENEFQYDPINPKCEPLILTRDMI